jgi:hypothetical protein
MQGKPFVVEQIGTLIIVMCESTELASKLAETLKPLLELQAYPKKTANEKVRELYS